MKYKVIYEVTVEADDDEQAAKIAGLFVGISWMECDERTEEQEAFYKSLPDDSRIHISKVEQIQ